jgi:GNAT superfamily N-acetyltransferase
MIMPKNPSVQIGPLRESELDEAGRIVRLAFGTFLGIPNPLEFMGDRDFITPRWRARNTKVLAARESGKLIGLNVATRWGSFGFFGPLTVLPEYWNRGIAQQLLTATMKVFRPLGRAAYRSVHLCAQSQTRGLVPEIRLLARASDRHHEAHSRFAFAETNQGRQSASSAFSAHPKQARAGHRSVRAPCK